MNYETVERNMKNKFGLERNQFVRIKGSGTEGFGIIEGFEADGQSVDLMNAEMADDFGVWSIALTEIEHVTEAEIKETLAEIESRYEEFPYFIIQLNDIEELSEYHIQENDFIKHLRETNVVLNESY